MTKQIKDTETKVEEVKTEEVKTSEAKVEEVKTSEAKVEEVKTPETIIDETFEKVTEETNKKLDEVNNFVFPEEVNYDILDSIDSKNKEIIEKIVEDEKLDLSKTLIQIASSKEDKNIYYRFKKESEELTDWKVYSNKNISLENIDIEIERILSEEHYFNFSVVGRFIIDGKYDNESLEKFAEEFKNSDILFNKNHYDLIDLLNKKFK